MYSLLWVKSLVPGQVGCEGVKQPYIAYKKSPCQWLRILYWWLEVYLHWTASGYADWCSISYSYCSTRHVHMCCYSLFAAVKIHLMVCMWGSECTGTEGLNQLLHIVN